MISYRMTAQSSQRIVLNLNAGAELLQCYEDKWKELHTQTVNSCKQAQAVSKLINKSSSDWWKINEKFVRLHQHLALLPDILQQVETLAAQVGSLEASFEEVCSSMVEYEHVYEDFQKQQKILKMQEDLKNLKLLKLSELEHLKGTLATKHATTLSELQARSRKTEPTSTKN